MCLPDCFTPTRWKTSWKPAGDWICCCRDWQGVKRIGSSVANGFRGAFFVVAGSRSDKMANRQFVASYELVVANSHSNTVAVV
jgi:hypothetical protein